MTISRLPINTPILLRRAGLEVIALPGWRNNDTGRPLAAVGTLWHHTGSYDKIGDTSSDLAYAKWMAFTGRSDLSAPLCNVAISREGTVYLCAGGRANHAGTAKAHGSVAAGNGNGLYIGFECMNDGTQGWDVKQMRAMELAAMVFHRDILKTSTNALAAHYETSVTGKWDPGDPRGIHFKGSRVLDMDRFRARVQSRINGKEDEMNADQEKLLKETLATAQRAETWGKSARAQAHAAHVKAIENRKILDAIMAKVGVQVDAVSTEQLAQMVADGIADDVADELSTRLKE